MDDAQCRQIEGKAVQNIEYRVSMYVMSCHAMPCDVVQCAMCNAQRVKCNVQNAHCTFVYCAM